MTPNQLPPLPEPYTSQRSALTNPHREKLFTIKQMHDYALAALAQQAQEPVALGLPIHNLRTLANGLRAAQVIDKRFIAALLDEIADYLRDLEQATPQPQPAPPVPAPVDEREAFEASMREKHGWEDRDFKSDSFGYFDGHTATAWLAWQARAALTLPAPQQATPKPVVPEMSSIALRKLGGLQDRGWQVNGYAIRRGNERGFVDASGFVGWWRSEIAPVAPDDHPLMVFAKERRLGAYMDHEVIHEAGKALAASHRPTPAPTVSTGVTVAIDHLHNERRDGMTDRIWPPVKIGTKLRSA